MKYFLISEKEQFHEPGMSSLCQDVMKYVLTWLMQTNGDQSMM